MVVCVVCAHVGDGECRQVLYSDSTAAYLARHVGHLAGLPVDVPALTINRFVCSSTSVLLTENWD